LETDLSILQGEVGGWNYLALKEFIEIFTPKRVHVAVETRDHSSVCRRFYRIVVSITKPVRAIP
jgi:hypothetical protein